MELMYIVRSIFQEKKKKKDLDLRTKIVLGQFLKDKLTKVCVQPQSKQTWC